MSGAPFLVFLGEGVAGKLADAVCVPEGVNEIDPLLGSVRTDRTFEQRARMREGLLKKSNQIVRASGAVLAGQLKLAVERFKLVANGVCRSILLQGRPIVKSIGD